LRILIRREIKETIERIWRAGEIFLEKPDVPSELRNVLHYLRHVFPVALIAQDQRFRQAWQAAGFDPDLVEHPESFPGLRFGNWVGGDRDGHPLVTAEVTGQTLQALRNNALSLLREMLVAVAARLGLSELWQPAPPVLRESIARLVALLGERGAAAAARNPREPWRQFVNLMLVRLPPESVNPPRVVTRILRSWWRISKSSASPSWKSGPAALRRWRSTLCCGS
jgi:phosphoenolpyruvate carboxylase